MHIFYSRQETDRRVLNNPVATLGVFDGVHLGHQQLLRDLRQFSEAVGGGDRVVVTFDRHPFEALDRPSPGFLTGLEQRLTLLQEHGASAVLVLQFDRELAAWSPERFAREVFLETLGAHHLLLGFDSRFGAAGQGDAAFLKEHPEWGFEVRVGRPKVLEEEVISSTKIREAVLSGDLEGAARSLGRAFSLSGRVVHGDARGRELGFPTANLELDHTVAPPRGVYLAALEYEKVRHPALVNIGRRPTFHRAASQGEGTDRYSPTLDRVEVYIHAEVGSLYQQKLSVELHGRVRSEQKFSGVESLVAQIGRDVEALESWWSEREED